MIGRGIPFPEAVCWSARNMTATAGGFNKWQYQDSVELTAEVVAAYVANNPIPRSELPALIQAMKSAIDGLGKGLEGAQPQVETKPPAVPVRKSITPDYLICLEDAKKFKSMRRHLRLHSLTPEQYRAKWSLPSNYTMLAPNYATRRSDIAKKMGLGRKRRRAG
jgi:predicted transcriptional regulator